MAATNDYVMPRIDGMPYLDKPIVYFAAEAAAMEVLGPTELAARLPAYLFTLATAFVLWWFARRVWDEEAALIAAIAYLAMPLTMAFARTVIFDSALSFFVVVAIVAFYLEVERGRLGRSGEASRLVTEDAAIGRDAQSLRAGRPRSMATLAWAAIAFGVITKGPVAIALPLLVAI